MAWRIPPWLTDTGGAYLVGRIIKEAICARTALPATFSWRCFTSPSLSSLLFAVRKCRSTSACHTCSLQSRTRAIWAAKVSPSLSCKSSSRLFDAACLLSRFHQPLWLRTSKYPFILPGLAAITCWIIMQSLHGRRSFFIFDRDSASTGVCAAHAAPISKLFNDSVLSFRILMCSYGFCIWDSRSEL